MEGAQTVSVSRVGFYAGMLTAALTLFALALALVAVPSSGAFCPADCAEYPYLDGAVQYPNDFLWMLPAMLTVLSFVVLLVCLHRSSSLRGAVYSHVALCVGLIAAAILLSDYYVQFFVVPVSLMNAETEGLPLIIQSNPHGVFLALEELGYLLMGVTFLFAGVAIDREDRLTVAARRVFISGFGLVALSCAVVFPVYGLERLDRLEVLIISIDWLVLIVNGILLSAMFRRRLNHPNRSEAQHVA
jgi:hypothetical protein